MSNLHPLVQGFVLESMTERPDGTPELRPGAAEAFGSRVSEERDPKVVGTIAQDLLRFAAVVEKKSRALAQALLDLAHRIAEGGCFRKGLLKVETTATEEGRRFLRFADKTEDRVTHEPAPEGSRRVAEMFPIRG